MTLKKHILNISRIAKESPAWGVAVLVLLIVIGKAAEIEFLLFPNLALTVMPYLFIFWIAGWVLYEAMKGGIVKPLLLSVIFAVLLFMLFNKISDDIATVGSFTLFAIYMYCGVLGWAGALHKICTVLGIRQERKKNTVFFAVAIILVLAFQTVFSEYHIYNILDRIFGE